MRRSLSVSRISIVPTVDLDPTIQNINSLEYLRSLTRLDGLIFWDEASKAVVPSTGYHAIEKPHWLIRTISHRPREARTSIVHIIIFLFLPNFLHRTRIRFSAQSYRMMSASSIQRTPPGCHKYKMSYWNFLHSAAHNHYFLIVIILKKDVWSDDVCSLSSIRAKALSGLLSPPARPLNRQKYVYRYFFIRNLKKEGERSDTFQLAAFFVKIRTVLPYFIKITIKSKPRTAPCEKQFWMNVQVR